MNLKEKKPKTFVKIITAVHESQWASVLPHYSHYTQSLGMLSIVSEAQRMFSGKLATPSCLVATEHRKRDHYPPFVRGYPS
jgi:hypothetical protein